MEKIIKQTINDNTYKIKNLEDNSIVIDCGSKFDFHIDLEDAKNIFKDSQLNDNNKIYIIDNYDNITYIISKKNNDLFLDLYKGNDINKIHFIHSLGSTEI